MTVQPAPAKREIFYQELKKVLLNLYDPTVINSSSLFDWLGVEPGARSSFLLQDLMTQAIEAVKPGPKVPASAKSWRSYHLLRQRYIEQFNQEEIAANLSVSTRQVQREEKIAREVLLDYLWVKYHLEEKPLPSGLEISAPPPPSAAAPTSSLAPSSATAAPTAPVPSIREELLHMASSVSKTPIQLTQVILQVISTLTPFLAQLGVAIELSEAASQAPIEAPEPVLRQALNQLLISAAKVCAGSPLRIEIASSPAEVLLVVTGTRIAQDPAASTGTPAREPFDLTADMIEMCGGKMTLPDAAPHSLHIRLSFPAEKLIPVLIVDDNPDSLQLFQRYLAGSPFQPTLLQNPHDVLNAAIALKPAGIVIDIMMPGLDGWMLLSQLRKHPATESIPVVVSTILPQRELALSLGVADFLPKPVRQDQLLSILNRLVNPEAQTPG